MAAQDPDTSVLLTYAVTIGGPMLIALVGVIWKMVRDEAKVNADALEKKASAEALREAKQEFNLRLERLDTSYRQLLQDLANRQDREIEWLKDEMDKLSSSVQEMRRENNAANTAILQRLHDLALNMATKATP